MLVGHLGARRPPSNSSLLFTLRLGKRFFRDDLGSLCHNSGYVLMYDLSILCGC